MTLALLWYGCNTCLFRKRAFSPLYADLVRVALPAQLWDGALFFQTRPSLPSMRHVHGISLYHFNIFNCILIYFNDCQDTYK